MLHTCWAHNCQGTCWASWRCSPVAMKIMAPVVRAISARCCPDPHLVAVEVHGDGVEVAQRRAVADGQQRDARLERRLVQLHLQRHTHEN